MGILHLRTRAAYLRTAALVVGVVLTLVGCQQKEALTERAVATAWADLSVELIGETAAGYPTSASRSLGYLGLTMYESVVHGYPEHRSLAGQLSGLVNLPAPDKPEQYVWSLALSAAQAEMLRALYPRASSTRLAQIDSLEARILTDARGRLSAARIDHSVAYGQRIAQMIFAWSRSDGGERTDLRISAEGLHPAWGTNRPFLPANYRMDPPAGVPFDTLIGSPYYAQLREVYERTGDVRWKHTVVPTDTYAAVTGLLRRGDYALIECVEMYARTGLALADAYVKCWKWKYTYRTPWPHTYVPTYIDPNWVTDRPVPPYPAFPSGEAMQAAAVAAAVPQMSGQLQDWPGGPHTRQDVEAGTERGGAIGRNVAALRWRR